MKSKLVFRILGALASALIIASVFIPFVSVTGFSQSLWQAHEAVGTIYLPIMIIVFGVIGVLVFSTGFKTELAYASAGGLLFFLIMQTIPVIDQAVFNTLGVGYYCLAIGTVLIVIMAFLCSLKVKQKVVEIPVVEEKKEVSVIDQIDKLYNDSSVNNVSNENTLSDIIQPIPIQNVSMNDSIQNNTLQPNIQNDLSIVEPLPLNDMNQVENQISTQQLDNPVVVENSIPVQQPLTDINPISNDFNVPEQNTNVNLGVLENSVAMEQSLPKANPAVTDFNMQESSVNSNPVVAEFSAPVNNMQESTSINPAVTDFNMQESSVNPVVAEFNNSQNNQFVQVTPVENPAVSQNIEEQIAQPQTTQEESLPIEPIRPLDSVNKVDVMADQQNSTGSNLDIFG